MRTAHIITRLIIGGAQQNTLHNVDDQHHIHGDEVTLITGPGVGPEGSLEQQALDRGLDLRVVPGLERNLNPLKDWAGYKAILRELRDFQPEIVHTHSSKAGILGRRAAMKLGLPTVHGVHGAAFHFGQSPILFHSYKMAERIAARWCEHFISVCDDMTREYVAAGIAPHEKFTTIYSGMEVEPFLNPPRPPEDVRTELNLEPHHIVVGKIARLFPLKGHDLLIEAARPVINACPDVRFLLVGDGILRDQHEQRLTELGIRDNFVLTGLVPPGQVPELIHAMDLVVHTSQWEGLARVLPQGLISGKPVISFDVGGAREVVIPNETGHLIQDQSAPDLAHAIIDLARSPEKRRQFGSTGRDRFTQQFRHQFMTERTREVYAKVLTEWKSRGGPAA